jgi:RNA polymerase sigma factor (sigma-70 family)
MWKGSHSQIRRSDGTIETYRQHKRRDRWHASESTGRHKDADVDESVWLYHNAVVPQEPGESTPEKLGAAELLLSKLSPAQREAVELCIMQGISHGDAADLLGISENAIDQRLSRARRIMKRHAQEAADLMDESPRPDDEQE